MEEKQSFTSIQKLLKISICFCFSLLPPPHRLSLSLSTNYHIYAKPPLSPLSENTETSQRSPRALIFSSHRLIRSEMATSIPLRRVAGRILFSGNLFRPVRCLSVSPSATRSFNTSTQMTRVDDDEREDRTDRAISRRRDFPGFFSDVWDPLAPTRSVSQLMNVMDQLMDNPLLSGPRGMGPIRRGWDVREDEDALHLKVDMPGLSKDDVKVCIEENTLVIRGEAEKETEEEESRRRYSTRIDLTPNAYKMDGIRAEMKNGVLKVMVPKLKEGGRKDVFQVQVD